MSLGIIEVNSPDTALLSLLNAAKPVLRIDGLKDETWTRREGKNPNDFRLGPWHAADWIVLDEEIYYSAGEVLYFVSDGASQVRYVGESKGRLRTRWRTPPLAEPRNGQQTLPLFHNIVWPKIEEAFKLSKGPGPFHVSVINVQALTELVQCHLHLNEAVDAIRQRTHGVKHLSWHVETWLCRHPDLSVNLWNVAKRTRGKKC